MMEGGMGQPGVAGKCRKTVTHGGGRRRLRRLDPGSSGVEILPAWSSSRPPPPLPERVQWWWPESAPTAET